MNNIDAIASPSTYPVSEWVSRSVGQSLIVSDWRLQLSHLRALRACFFSATVSQQLLQIAKISSMYQTKTMHATQTNKGSKQTNKQVQQLSNNETDPHCHLCFDLRAPSSLQNPVQWHFLEKICLKIKAYFQIEELGKEKGEEGRRCVRSFCRSRPRLAQTLRHWDIERPDTYYWENPELPS